MEEAVLNRCLPGCFVATVHFSLLVAKHVIYGNDDVKKVTLY